jgi:hypothetical protein
MLIQDIPGYIDSFNKRFLNVFEICLSVIVAVDLGAAGINQNAYCNNRVNRAGVSTPDGAAATQRVHEATWIPFEGCRIQPYIGDIIEGAKLSIKQFA